LQPSPAAACLHAAAASSAPRSPRACISRASRCSRSSRDASWLGFQLQASAAATKDKVSIYDAQKFKIAWWAAQAAERAAKKEMQAETATSKRGKRQRHQGSGQRTASSSNPPPPPVRTKPSHTHPIPRIPLQAVQGDPYIRVRCSDTAPANLQNPTPNNYPAPPIIRDIPTTQHEATQSQTGECARSQTEPTTPQRRSPDNPTALPIIPTIQHKAIPPAPTHARPMRTLRSAA
jgi:hypothetical protein